jgi:hypothetical protein
MTIGSPKDGVTRSGSWLGYEVLVPSRTLISIEVEIVDKPGSEGNIHRYVPTLTFTDSDESQRREKLVEWGGRARQGIRRPLLSHSAVARRTRSAITTPHIFGIDETVSRPAGQGHPSGKA